MAADLIDLEEKEYKNFYEIFYGMDLVFKRKSEDEKWNIKKFLTKHIVV